MANSSSRISSRVSRGRIGQAFSTALPMLRIASRAKSAACSMGTALSSPCSALAAPLLESSRFPAENPQVFCPTWGYYSNAGRALNRESSPRMASVPILWTDLPSASRRNEAKTYRVLRTRSYSVRVKTAVTPALLDMPQQQEARQRGELGVALRPRIGGAGALTSSISLLGNAWLSNGQHVASATNFDGARRRSAVNRQQNQLKSHAYALRHVMCPSAVQPRCGQRVF